MTAMSPIKTLCPVCSSPLVQSRHEWLFHCSECRLLASSLKPNIPRDKKNTAIDENSRLSGLYKSRTRSNQEILAFLKDHLPRDGRRIVDVGCGHGLFIKDALAAGFDAEGIEPDANVVDLARISTKTPVRHGYFPAVLQSDDTYDAIVFNDVIEHIPSVADAISAAYRHLNAGGILVLNCPDQDGIFYRIADIMDQMKISGPFLRMWQYGLPSPHVWYFNARHLVRIGEQAGLTSLHVKQLKPLTASGLWARVSYVEGQSRFLNIATILAASIMLPFLSMLPKDTSIAFLRKDAA